MWTRIGSYRMLLCTIGEFRLAAVGHFHSHHYTRGLTRGHVCCDRCGLSLRQHVLMALRTAKRLDHKFACVGE